MEGAAGPEIRRTDSKFRLSLACHRRKCSSSNSLCAVGENADG